MKSKLKIIVPLVLLLAGGVYKFGLAKAAPVHKPKIAGSVYVLPKDFLINLQGGHFAKLGVALVFKEGYTGAPAGGAHGGSAAPSVEGYGSLPQEAVVRSIVTDVLTDETPGHLQTKKGRKKLQKEIFARVEKQTDVEASDVLFTDVAIQ